MRFLALPTLLLLTVSCATLDITGLQQGEKEAFEPLILKPSLEATGLRIDLIREQESYRVNDSIEEMRDSPYHPLGFDLGNGLFYDLDGNLSLRLEDLLGVRGNPCYSISHTRRKRQLWADQVFTFCQGELTVAYPPGKRERHVLRLEFDGNSTRVMHRIRLDYAVDFNDQTIVYRGKRRKWDTLHKRDENHYYRAKFLWRENYLLEGGHLDLNRKYLIELINQDRTLRVLRPGLFGYRTLTTIEKSGDNLYLFERGGFRGKRIVMTGNGLHIYQNRNFSEGWSRNGPLCP